MIFLEALADLKDRYMGRLELFHFLAEEEGEVDLFNGMLDAARCGEAIDRLVVDPDGVDALVHLRAGTDDGRRRKRADRARHRP